MGQEITQYNISDRQLLATNAQASVWTDIGEAKVIHTIFGRAKIHVTREKDKNFRAGLLTALAVTAIAAAAWQGWITSQQTELLQNAAPPLPLSARIRVSPPDTQPEYVSSPTTSPSAENRFGMPVQTATNTTIQNSAPPIGLRSTRRMAVKPDMAQPLIASKPQTEPLATNNNSSMNQTDVQQPHKPSVPIQPIAPIVAPLIKANTSATSPAGGNQLSAPVSAQSK